jgi:membrane-bound serine protease (ClpP class)
MATEWIIGLAVVGLLLVLAEMLVPGAVIGITGGICLLVSVVAAFLPPHGNTFGFSLLGGVVVAGGLLFWGWLVFFPRSRMGKRMILQQDGRDWHGFDKTQETLLGKSGTAHSMLRPAGIAVIEGRRVDVVTRGEMIDAGTPVAVVEVEGNRVVVATAKTSK